MGLLSFIKLATDMENTLFVGTNKNLAINTVLRSASEYVAKLGIQATLEDFMVVRVENGVRKQNEDDLLDDQSVIELFFKDNPNWIVVTQFENEIHPGYSVITEPSLVGVSVWVGADAICQAMAAIIAAAVAIHAQSKINDSEHLWSDQEMNEPNRFMESVKAKFSKM